MREWLGFIACCIAAYVMLVHTKDSFLSDSNGNAMVIVEPRKHAKLAYVLRNYDKNVDPSYTLYIFHGKSAGEFARDAAKDVTRRKVIYVPLKVDNLSADEYNALLKTPSFYDAIDAENILIFQTDSVSCEKSPFRMKDFEEYGYVGCPYDNSIGKGVHWGESNSFYGVGGLSFRQKSAALACIASEKTDAKFPEDVFFSNCVEKGYGRKPEHAGVLQSLCTQNYHGRPSFGVHKPELLQKDHVTALLEHCPESAELF